MEENLESVAELAARKASWRDCITLPPECKARSCSRADSDSESVVKVFVGSIVGWKRAATKENLGDYNSRKSIRYRTRRRKYVLNVESLCGINVLLCRIPGKPLAVGRREENGSIENVPYLNLQ